ncbi:MAG: hypothetical protein Unbinned200contig1002_27 [Prokaryotic dsDNA virus sp.]|jgi:hypothetical protein|nr:hypothetical protein [Flavobacteriaceae bacterium]QDP68326.1 MAG: hypothetical protein Unbinned200contig1002_27 [Prokaryotic dsDNA virus sp.]|tara:strand:- start:1364 stop:1786 length:423 start_codon:yes stop_codon:yes gene_type:complete
MAKITKAKKSTSTKGKTVKKTATKGKTVKKTATKGKTMKKPTPVKIDVVQNDHGILLMTLPTKKGYDVRVSIRKVASILNTQNEPNMMKEVQKHGRTLYQIQHMDGSGKFNVGITKINAVLDNSKAVMKVLTKVYEENNA